MVQRIAALRARTVLPPPRQAERPRATDPACPTAAPAAAERSPAEQELADAAELARTTGRRAELVSRRAANETHYVNPDGSLTMEVTPYPTRVRRDGTWVDI